jgi:iron complex outermembrane recepter protein
MTHKRTLKDVFHFNDTKKALYACCITFLAAIGPTWGQHIAPSDSITWSKALDSTVVIQATRAASGSPVPHTNLRAKEIAAVYHAQDIPMLLTGVPGVVEASDAGAGVGYTGMRVRGTDPTRINVTINGVPFNDAESQGVFWVNLPDLAASASEIQLQRGVGTSTHGAGAFGATLNIDLSRFEVEPGLTATQTVGAFGTRKSALQWRTGLLREHWAFSGRISGIDSDGFVDRASSRLRSTHLTGTWLDDRQSVQVHFLDGRERTYQSWYGLPAQYLDIDSLRTYNPAGTERADQPYPDEVDNYTQRHLLAHYKRQINSNTYLQINGHYTRGFGYYEQYRANESLADFGMPSLQIGDTILTTSDLAYRLWLDNHFGGATWLLRWAASSRSEWKIGGGANQYNGKHFGEVVWASISTAPAGHRYYDNDARKRDINFYVQNNTRLGRYTTAFADMQVRYVDYTFLGFDNELRNVTQTADLLFFNPKLGLTHQLTRAAQLYAYAGVGHREPNRADYTQSTPSSRPLAERMLDVEMGSRFAQSWWSATANLYGMWYRDQLVVDGRINDVGAYIRTNVPESSRLGIELEGSIKPCKSLIINGNATFNRNRIREFTAFVDDWDTGLQEEITYRDVPLAFSPAMTAFGGVTWVQDISTLQKNTQQVSATLTAKHVGQQFLDNTGNTATALPAYTFCDLRLNYDWTGMDWCQRISVIGTVHNLLDARYEANGWVYRFRSAGYDPRPDDAYVRAEGAGVYHQAGFFPQAGRHWNLTLKVEF